MSVTVTTDPDEVSTVVLDMYNQINNVLQNNPIEEVVSVLVSTLFNVLDSIEDPEMQLCVSKDIESVISSFVSQKESNH